jgi:uncharacterized membrane-anchored protein
MARWLIALVALCCLGSIARAQSQTAPQTTPQTAQETRDAEQRQMAQLLALKARLTPMTGIIKLPESNVTLKLDSKYYFLPADQARTVIVQAWGNPESVAEGVLGIVFPAGKSFLDETWGAVITYEATGYVPDEEAAGQDYDDMIKQVQLDENGLNQARSKDGYTTQHLVGWAQKPTYDAGHHTMIWARQINFGGQKNDTLNYDIRILGRRGVLSVNMVDIMPRLALVNRDASLLAQKVGFDAGSSYADFDAETDAKADYGVAGLVAGGLGLVAAKKLGLIAIAAAFGKKFIAIIIGLGLMGWKAARKFFTRKPAGPGDDAA